MTNHFSFLTCQFQLSSLNFDSFTSSRKDRVIQIKKTEAIKSIQSTPNLIQISKKYFFDFSSQKVFQMLSLGKKKSLPCAESALRQIEIGLWVRLKCRISRKETARYMLKCIFWFVIGRSHDSNAFIFRGIWYQKMNISDNQLRLNRLTMTNEKKEDKGYKVNGLYDSAVVSPKFASFQVESTQYAQYNQVKATSKCCPLAADKRNCHSNSRVVAIWRRRGKQKKP